MISLGLVALKATPLWLSGLPAFLLVGFMQYRLVMASHEAVHRNLLTPVLLNEVAGLFNSFAVGISFLNYRQAHIEHHKAPQSIQDDVDGYIYRPLLLAPPGFPRLRLLVVGLFVDIYEKFRRKLFGHATPPETVAKQGAIGTGPKWARLQIVGIAGVQGCILILFTLYLNWWSYFIFWLAPIFLIALFLDRARTFLEHGYNYFFPGPPVPNLAEVDQSTIDVRTNALERYLFAPFGFSYHQAHHAQLTVPFYHLPQLTDLLEGNQPGYHRRVEGSYVTILFRMLWAHK